MFQWGLLSWEPNLDIWGKTNLGVKVSVSGRTSILSHKPHATIMIWKQRAKLVMATARGALKHPIYGIVILRLGIYTNRPNVSKLCPFISSMNPSILISVIQENKLLASVPCFQKICLLSTNDLCFLTITCRPSRSSFLFLFVSFLCSQKLYIHCHLRENFSLYTFIPIHDELFLYTHALKLFLFTSTRFIYKPYSCSKISFFLICSLFLYLLSSFPFCSLFHFIHFIFFFSIFICLFLFLVCCFFSFFFMRYFAT